MYLIDFFYTLIIAAFPKADVPCNDLVIKESPTISADNTCFQTVCRTLVFSKKQTGRISTRYTLRLDRLLGSWIMRVVRPIYHHGRSHDLVIRTEVPDIGRVT